MKTVEKAMEIMEILTASYEPIKMKTICEHCGINKTSAYKILADPCRYGYAQKTHNNSRYQIGSKLKDRIAQRLKDRCAFSCNPKAMGCAYGSKKAEADEWEIKTPSCKIEAGLPTAETT